MEAPTHPMPITDTELAKRLIDTNEEIERLQTEIREIEGRIEEANSRRLTLYLEAAARVQRDYLAMYPHQGGAGLKIGSRAGAGCRGIGPLRPFVAAVGGGGCTGPQAAQAGKRTAQGP